MKIDLFSLIITVFINGKPPRHPPLVECHPQPKADRLFNPDRIREEEIPKFPF